jgi:glycosyltransferase involved in cell wall biosynthesis
VLATRQGSVPEVVSDGESGVIGDSVDDLIKRLPEAAALDRTRMREYAISNFSPEHMVSGHEAVYEAMLSAS